MKLASKTLALVLVLVLMLCAVPAVFAAAGDSASETIAWDGTTDLNVTVQPGETKYYSAPVGGKQITVTVGGANQAVNVLDANGEIITTASNRRGNDIPGIVAYADKAEGAEVIFALSVDDFGSEATVTVTVGEIVYGSYDMPLDLNKQGPGDYYHFFDAVITDDWDPTYYCTYTAEVDGVLVIEHEPVGETGDYSIEITDENYNVIAGDAWENAVSPMISWAVEEGKTYTIAIIGWAAGDEIKGTLINYETAEEAVSINGTEVKLPVNAGASITIVDGARNPKWNGKGVIVTCDTDGVIGNTQVLYNGTAYTDADGDGMICLTMEATASGSMMIVRNELTIVNGANENATYDIQITDDAQTEGCTHPNMEYSPAVEQGCHETGMKEYWYCPDCDCYYTDAEGKYNIAKLSLTIPADYDLDYHEAVEACHVDGYKEYWHCPGCDMIFDNPEGNPTGLTIKDLILFADGSLIHVEAKEAVCHEPGNIEYWYCPDCGGHYTDAEGKHPIASKSVFLDADYPLTYTPAVESVCHEYGMAEYWYCAECDCYFTDPQGKHNVAYLSLTTAPKYELTHYAAVEACHVDGYKEYWKCPECDVIFDNPDGNPTGLTVKDMILFADSQLIHVEAKESVCHEPGNIEYWYCPDCGGFYTDAEGKQVTTSKSIFTDADYPLLYTPAVEPGCHQTGMAEYWYCAECDCYFTDAQGKHNVAYLSLTLNPTSVVDHVEAVEATAEQKGNYEYWICQECHTVFADEALTVVSNLMNMTIPAAGYPSDTGDTIIAVVLAAAMSVTGLVVLKKKKH